ncbi:MAG: DMT family transporter [Bacteroidales bacterium]|nr:DMT family transporter [Bacteroidales bacterium]
MKKTFVYLLLAFAAIVWGISFIMTKELFQSEEHITVLIILTFRLLLASAVTIPTLLLLHKLEPIKKGDLKWFLLLALCEPFIYSICETSGVRLVSGSMASIVVATIPLFVPFGMAAAYKEKIRGITLVGIALSLVGLSVMLLFGNGGTASNIDANPAGLAWLAGAVAIAVVFTIVLVKLVDRYKPFTITAYQNLFGCIYFIPVMLMLDGGSLPLLSYSGKMIVLLLLLGVFCSTVAYVFYNIGVARLGASAACIFTNVIPVFSLLAALLIGQEQFSWSKPIGILIVVTGVVLAQIKTDNR